MDIPAQELRNRIFDLIEETVAQSPLNSIEAINVPRIFEEPLMGVADGQDRLFEDYKTIIGDFHQTPREILLRRSHETGVELGPDIRVVCWALPFSRQIKAANQGKEVWPSIHWAYGTRFGEELNNELRRVVESFLTGLGIAAVAPVAEAHWRRIEDLPGGHTSNWSERHALYAAGLGTFSLNDGFITEKGMAMRCGSVVLNAALPVTPRTAASHRENCLFCSAGQCGRCMERCPAYAITAKGHDKVVCRRYREGLFRDFLHGTCGVDLDVGECGLCQTAVPCESRNPMAKRPDPAETD
jgi:epoxyqueuosine reductase QueG